MIEDSDQKQESLELMYNIYFSIESYQPEAY